MGADFGDEVQKMYDSLLDSCAEISLNIEESFCAEQKTESYGSNSTCDHYLPCTQSEVLEVYVDSGCHSIHSKYLSFLWISLIFIFRILILS